MASKTKYVMKTKQFAMMLLAVALTLGATATKIPKMNIVSLDDSRALITAETDSKVPSEISIATENGRIVYYKRSKAAAVFKSVFDLSKLENGIYTVKITTGNASAIREVKVNNGEVKVTAMKTQIEPYFACDGDLLKVSYLNFGGDDISLLIYNGSQLVFESGIGTQFNIQKGFDISRLVRGNYEVVLAGTSEDFNYRISR